MVRSKSRKNTKFDKKISQSDKSKISIKKILMKIVQCHRKIEKKEIFGFFRDIFLLLLLLCHLRVKVFNIHRGKTVMN